MQVSSIKYETVNGKINDAVYDDMIDVVTLSCRGIRKIVEIKGLKMLKILYL
jgi:hypothetical protein